MAFKSSSKDRKQLNKEIDNLDYILNWLEKTSSSSYKNAINYSKFQEYDEFIQKEYNIIATEHFYALRQINANSSPYKLKKFLKSFMEMGEYWKRQAESQIIKKQSSIQLTIICNSFLLLELLYELRTGVNRCLLSYGDNSSLSGLASIYIIPALKFKEDYQNLIKDIPRKLATKCLE
jgi:hypothetical protein